MRFVSIICALLLSNIVFAGEGQNLQIEEIPVTANPLSLQSDEMAVPVSF